MPNKNPKINIVDYGFGNLFSVVKALEYLGVRAEIIDKPNRIQESDGLILPGVGAFGDGIKELDKRGFTQPIIDFAQSGKSLLGICLGMQFLFEYSEEFGSHKGLGLIAGKVKKINILSKYSSEYKIPHVGWNELLIPKQRKHWKDTILSSVQESEQVYFVHSYAGYTKDEKDILAYVKHGGNTITAAVMKDNITGTQFHPEKSGVVGLNILNQFIKNITL